MCPYLFSFALTTDMCPLVAHRDIFQCRASLVANSV